MRRIGAMECGAGLAGVCRATVLSLGLLTGVSAVAAETVRSIDRSGVGGAEIRIFTYTPHRADCSPIDDVRIVMRVPPGHGSLTTRPDTIIAGPSRLGAADCSGRPMAGLGLYYLPQAGYHGTDRFEYDAVFSNGTEHAAATVIVR